MRKAFFLSAQAQGKCRVVSLSRLRQSSPPLHLCTLCTLCTNRMWKRKLGRKGPNGGECGWMSAECSCKSVTGSAPGEARKRRSTEY